MIIPRVPQALHLHLAQPWLEQAETGFQPARASLSWTATHLHLHAILEDSQPFSASTGHSQTLHLLGDTLEVFLMLPGAAEYYELHVSPNNHRTALRWPLGAIEKVRREELALESFRKDPEAFSSEVQLTSGAWEVRLDIPVGLLNLPQFLSRQPLLLSICRYDYQDPANPPILSTTASHQVKNFHRIDDWLPVTLSD